MNVLNLGILCVCGALLSLMLKSLYPVYGALLSIAVCVLIIACSVGKINSIILYISEINEYLGIEKMYISVLIKMIGVTYIAGFASDICKDSGHQAMASQIQIFGKLTIMAVCMPIFVNLLEAIRSII